MPNSTPEPKLLIAVVDDHELFRTTTCRLLEELGYDACAYGSVVEFITSNVISRIHCLLLDVTMPDIDGFALQECLQKTNYDVPIIFCTGLDDEETKNRALTKGAFSYLQKPIKAESLAGAIRSACSAAAEAKSAPSSKPSDFGRPR